MTLDCTCNRLKEAEVKSRAMSYLLEEAIDALECQPGFFKCLKCDYFGILGCLAVEDIKEKKRIIEGDAA